jgi:hypothetical protein
MPEPLDSGVLAIMNTGVPMEGWRLLSVPSDVQVWHQRWVADGIAPVQAKDHQSCSCGAEADVRLRLTPARLPLQVGIPTLITMSP